MLTLKEEGSHCTAFHVAVSLLMRQFYSSAAMTFSRCEGALRDEDRCLALSAN